MLEMGRLWSLMSWKERRFGSCCGLELAALGEGGLVGGLGFDSRDRLCLWLWGWGLCVLSPGCCRMLGLF